MYIHLFGTFQIWRKGNKPSTLPKPNQAAAASLDETHALMATPANGKQRPASASSAYDELAFDGQSGKIIHGPGAGVARSPPQVTTTLAPPTSNQTSEESAKTAAGFGVPFRT